MQDFIFYAFLSLLIPLGVGFFRFRQLTIESKFIFALCGVGFMLDSIGTILWMTKTSNLWVGHLYTMLEFPLLALAYRHAFGDFIRPIRMYALIGVFTVLAFSNSLFLQDLQQFNSYIKIVEALLLIMFSLEFFYKLSREMTVIKLEQYPMFWINSAVLIYFSSNLFVFLYSNYILLYSQGLGIRIWFIHALFFVLFNALLAVGLWIVPKNSNLRG